VKRLGYVLTSLAIAITVVFTLVLLLFQPAQASSFIAGASDNTSDLDCEWVGSSLYQLMDQVTISPTMRGGDCTSVYTITNEGIGTATTVHEFYDETDQPIHSFDDTVAVGNSKVYDLDAITELLEGYVGYVIVSSDQPITYTLDACPSPPSPPSDLSSSFKSVNLTSIEDGDILTYTLALRNDSTTTATAVLTDSIPTHTIYIPNSAYVSDGSSVVTGGSELLWSGQVVSGTPIIIQFAVEVTATGMAPGDPITNVAYLENEVGDVITLEVESVYNPGYGMTINDGMLYTNIPTVTLSITWGHEVPEITKMWISNDGGFGDGTDWITASQTYYGWLLDTDGDLQTERTVYVKFRDSSGGQYGPIPDGIIYDPVAPQVTQVEIITDSGSTDTSELRAMVGRDVIVRVASSDDNSGAGTAQVSHDGENYSDFAITGSTTDIPWTLQPSGEVYVRVVDRAGNPSDVRIEQGPPNHLVFLPLVLRPPQ
jgi:uncharacterized repeat protein (TIGR01451 family)